ncbi:MgtC/SapB family protein [Vogesella indigofera]|uniref:MgtC/SapB family protein n=1 Tax=Vogesella indigofera TaxID=45465 RepID=UPI00234EEACB|nr:MgtC/SapB family protein [Vogesella indigofera]MDC7709786.1 MgtC/SapB family protein [Vogesella indigofera]
MSNWDLGSWLSLADSPYAALPAIVTSLGIGLLMGVERERKKRTLAGIRTFPMTAVFGCLLAVLSQHGSPNWLLPALGLLVIASLGFLPLGRESEENEPRTTTVVALVVAYGLGLLSANGLEELAVAVAIIVTALMYLKPELSGISQRLDRRDLLALLQFAALTFIVLPVLPNQGFGPYAAFNPYRVWLMVVLIVGVGLAGYFAVRMLGERVGTPVLGILGGLVSTTATSLVYARAARDNPASVALSARVILLANLVLFVRLALITMAVAPAALEGAILLMAPPLLLGLLTVMLRPRHPANGQRETPALQLSNPAELKLALSFALVFAIVLVCSAWLNDLFGQRGVYVIALISGLNDVDAITLTALEMLGKQQLTLIPTLLAISIAITSNTLFKFGLISSLGGRLLALRCLPTFVVMLLGLGIGLWLNLIAG